MAERDPGIIASSIIIAWGPADKLLLEISTQSHSSRRKPLDPDLSHRQGRERAWT